MSSKIVFVPAHIFADGEVAVRASYFLNVRKIRNFVYSSHAGYFLIHHKDHGALYVKQEYLLPFIHPVE